MQPEALLNIHVLNEADELVGVVSVIGLLQSAPDTPVLEVADLDPVRVTPAADVTDIALLMADYNLVSIPVVDTRDHVLGVVTFDDLLEATVPEDWRRREPAPHPIRETSSEETDYGQPGRIGPWLSLISNRTSRRHQRFRSSSILCRATAGASAVLDSAHLGDIEGAFGRIRMDETDHGRTLKTRLITLLAIVGPGLIVMVGDNDAGGVATYSQAGQNYGYSLLWVLLLLIPVLIVNQEMVVRLGAVTGVGHARLINERFGRGWGWFSVGDLFLLNFLTIVTEFIGISLAASYFGVSKYIVVPTRSGRVGGDHGLGQFSALGAGHVRIHRGHVVADSDAVVVTSAVGRRCP